MCELTAFFHRTFSFAHDLCRKPVPVPIITRIRSSVHARTEKKCAASPGGTLVILLAAHALSTQAAKSLAPDSNLPQVPILTEKPLIVGVPGLQTLAGESLDIVAFA